MTTIKTIAAALALTATISAPAMSAQAATANAVSVNFADLNLASEQGRAIFDRRIANAAEKLCGPMTGTLQMKRVVKKCQQDTVAAVQPSRDLAVADYAAKRFAKADSKVIRLVAK